MPTVMKQVTGAAAVSLLTTELNSLGNNSNTAAGSAVNNVAGGDTNMDGYTRGFVELTLAAYTGTPTAGTGMSVWFLQRVDGTNYEDGGTSATPARMADVFIPVRPLLSGPQRITVPCWLPPGVWKPLGRNEGTGITWASSGNTLKVLSNTKEGV